MSAPTDPAARIGQAVLSALRDLAPANEVPRWVDLAAEAKRRGMGTPALRQFCIKYGVEIRAGTHRRAWVSPQAIDAAIERLPVARSAPSRQTGAERDAELEAAVVRATNRRTAPAPR